MSVCVWYTSSYFSVSLSWSWRHIRVYLSVFQKKSQSQQERFLVGLGRIMDEWKESFLAILPQILPYQTVEIEGLTLNKFVLSTLRLYLDFCRMFVQMGLRQGESPFLDLWFFRCCTKRFYQFIVSRYSWCIAKNKGMYKNILWIKVYVICHPFEIIYWLFWQI